MAIEILRRRPPSELYPSKAAVDLIRHFEGLSLTGYLDSIGKPTIGYGNTGPAAVVGARITLAEADALYARAREMWEELGRDDDIRRMESRIHRVSET